MLKKTILLGKFLLLGLLVGHPALADAAPPTGSFFTLEAQMANGSWIVGESIGPPVGPSTPIDLLNCTFDFLTQFDDAAGGGGGSFFGPPINSVLAVYKISDLATTALLREHFLGNPFQQIIVTYFDDLTQLNPGRQWTLTLEDVQITQFIIAGFEGGEGLFGAEESINFLATRVTYRDEITNGQIGWDFQTNTPTRSADVAASTRALKLPISEDVRLLRIGSDGAVLEELFRGDVIAGKEKFEWPVQDSKSAALLRLEWPGGEFTTQVGGES